MKINNFFVSVLSVLFVIPISSTPLVQNKIPKHISERRASNQPAPAKGKRDLNEPDTIKSDNQKQPTDNSSNGSFWKKLGAWSAGTAALLGTMYAIYLQSSSEPELKEHYTIPQGQTTAQFLKNSFVNVKTVPEFNKVMAKVKEYNGMQEFISSDDGQDIIKKKLVAIVVPLQNQLNKVYEKMSHYLLFDPQKVWLKEPYVNIPLEPIKLITPFPVEESSISRVKISINATNSLGENALMHALIGGDLDLAQKLIISGVNLMQQRKDGQTALLIALSRPADSPLKIEKANRLLLEAQPSLANKADKQG